jgi:2-hydroxychromene-2-carboxylate isomerase
MPGSVDFYYDYGSPAAYLAWTQIPALCAEQGAALNYRPMLLGGVFKATGNDTPVRVEAKGRWIMQDFTRHARKYGVPFAMNPHFIINTLNAMRGAVWAEEAGCLEPYNEALYRATWVDGRDTGNVDEIAAIVSEVGLDAAAMADAIQTPEIKQGLIARTEAAVARGVFGAPTMFVGDEMHFGQDRLDWVRDALAQ